MSTLKSIIQKLLENKKEDTYYDFKQQWHKNNVDLIHDIICLANCKHDGDRYLIIGVSDDYQIIGIADNSKTQADIINTLRDTKFANKLFPSISLDSIEINGKNIQVLSIENKPEKPYYLEEDKTTNKKTIYKGLIYTRNRDSNTPKDKTANTSEIEYMYQERFGLTTTPYDRFKIYLQDVDQWKQEDPDDELDKKEIEENDYLGKYIYKKDPLYQIKIYDYRKFDSYLSCLNSSNKHKIEYYRYVKNQTLPTSVMKLIYAGNEIERIHTCSFYNDLKFFAFPDNDDIYTGDNYYPIEFLYYQKSDIKPYLTYFLTYFKQDEKIDFDDFNKIQVKGYNDFYLPIIFF